jgi:hypothetical protein
MHRGDNDLIAHSVDNFAHPSRFVRCRHRHVIDASLIDAPSATPWHDGRRGTRQ